MFPPRISVTRYHLRARAVDKGNLGQKEAQLEKDRDFDLSHMGEKSSETDNRFGVGHRLVPSLLLLVLL